MSKKRKNSRSAFDQFGPEIGKLGEILQSSVVKTGSSLELVIENEISKKYKLIDDEISFKNNSIYKNKSKNIFLNINEKLFKKNNKYYFKKLSFEKNDSNLIEVDLVLFENDTISLFEIKSSNQLDSKKANQEVNSLFECKKIIHEIFNKNNININVSLNFLIF